MKENTHKNEMLDFAIQYLKRAKQIKTESVELNNMLHDDGTVTVSIEIDYPAKDTEEVHYHV